MGPGLFSHGCVVQGQRVMDGLGLPPFLPHRHGDESNAFSWKALNDSGVFFFLPALIVGKHSFISFSCRVAWGQWSNCSSQTQSLKCLSLCFLQAGTALQQHCVSVETFCFQECQNCHSQVGAAPGHDFCTSCFSVQIQKDFCCSRSKFYFIQCFQH